MNKSFVLENLSDESLDAILSLPLDRKASYFTGMIKSFYPKVEEDTPEFDNLIGTYVSSFYVEKIYRSNRFFNEKFTPIYTSTGLIRNIIADMYYADDDLITH
jgi:hypothetical protein